VTASAGFEAHSVLRKNGPFFGNSKLVVGSGWWCAARPPEWAIGSSFTRSTSFFPLWLAHVRDSLNPSGIMVVDSRSPIVPAKRLRDQVRWVSLDENYGHAVDLRSSSIDAKYSGFTRSVLMSAMYALTCDSDFVYVEQDCLLFGRDLLKAATDGLAGDIFLGAPAENALGLNGQIAARKIQQSLIYVRKSGLERFIAGLLQTPLKDSEVSPENIMQSAVHPFELLNIPYGRSRPINPKLPHFYAQHLSDDELFALRSHLLVQKSERFQRGLESDLVTPSVFKKLDRQCDIAQQSD
jgi:hypothetical protein